MFKQIIYRVLCLILTLGMTSGVLCMPAFAAEDSESETVFLASSGGFEGGTGTEEDPFLISTQEQLAAIADMPTYSFKLINDIELSGTWVPIGTYGDTFSGTLDGDGYTISNLQFDVYQYIGLFAQNDGTIMNLNLVVNQADTLEYTSASSAYVGGLMGYNTGEIYNCIVSGSLSYSKTYSSTTVYYSYVGGLVGYNYYTTASINNCVSTVAVTSSSENTYSGAYSAFAYSYAGGLIGYNNYGSVTNCYAFSDIVSKSTVSSNSAKYARSYAGGLVGCNNSGTITNSYAVSTVSASASGYSTSTYARGLTYSGSTGGVTNSYYDMNVSGCTDTGYGEPKSTLGMKVQATYTDWDFDTVWGMDSEINDGYPYIKNAKYVPTSGIDISKDNIYLAVNESAALTVEVSPANATSSTANWTSSDTSVATVDENGTVTGVSRGTTTITATTSDGKYTDTCTITVSTSRTAVTGVELDTSTLTLDAYIGDTTQLTATITPSDVTDSTLHWSSSNENVATVSDDGLVTAVGAGTATITVSTNDGDYTAVCDVTVISSKIDVYGIEISDSVIDMYINTEETLTATVLPDNASEKDVTWTSSNESIATVTQDGTVSALGEGAAVITATSSDGGYSASCTVNVTIPVSQITLNKSSSALKAGKTETLTATIYPSTATNKNVAWTSSNPAVATVTQDGTVTGISEGTAVITVTSENGGYTASCTVSVTVAAEGITISKSELSLNLGDSETLTAVISPADASDRTIVWNSSNPEIATVSDAGVITTLAKGTTTITASTSDGSYSDSCTVTVVVPVTGITLNKSSLALKSGNSETLTATVTPSNASYKDVSWSSSNPEVATVSANGVITAVQDGTTVITATTADEKYSASCEVTVTTAVTGITLDSTELSLIAGETETLSATVSPSTATNKSVSWSSSKESVATVSSSGLVTAVSSGTATITATTADSGYTTKCTVNVTIPVTSITLNSTSVTLNVGSKKSLTATVTPSNATDTSVTWKTSDSSIATVTQAGTVTAVSSGTALITATTSNGLTAQCFVTVNSVTTSITLNKSQLSMNVGGVDKLEAIVSPSDSVSDVVWTSSNSCVSVSSNGTLTANSVGSSVITATSNGYSASCLVTVSAESISVSSVSISESEIIMAVGDTHTAEAAVSPADATDTELTWTSSDSSVADVNTAGMITAYSAGVTTIRAKASNGVYDECIVHVVSASDASIVLTGDKVSPGTKAYVKASVLKNPGISAYKFTVSYDGSILTPCNVTYNESFGGTFTANLDDTDDGEFNILWYSNTDCSTNGDLFEIEFDVKDTAQYGDVSDVTIEYTSGDICNVAGDNVAFYIENTSVEVADPLPGDVYEDGEIKVYDLTLLSRYVARLETLTDRQMIAADVNDDGEVDIKDVVRLARYLVGYSDATLVSLANTSQMDMYVGTAAISSDGIAEIPVYVTSNTGFSGLELELDYNSTELEITEITPADGLPKSENFRTNLGAENGNKLRVIWYDTEDTTVTGTLFTVKAKLKQGDISAISIASDTSKVCDSAENDVDVSYELGYVIAENMTVVTTETEGGISLDVYSDAQIEATVILAAYDEEDVLLDLRISNTTLNNGKTTIDFNGLGEDYDSYKYFIWDNLDSMQPLK